MRLRRVWLTCIACLTASACGEGRGPVSFAVDSVSPTDPRALFLTINSCNAHPTARVVEESPTEVVIRVEANGGNHEDCADGARVCLKAPLNGRMVRDQLTGLSLTTSSPVPPFDPGPPCPAP